MYVKKLFIVKNQDNFKLNKASFLNSWENNFVLSILPFVD